MEKYSEYLNFCKVENLIPSVSYSLIYSRVLQIVSRMHRSRDAGEAALFILGWAVTLGLPREPFTLLLQNYWGCTNLLSLIIT